jgi:hypothetical protein
VLDATPPPPLVIRVTGSSESLAVGSCFIRIRSRVVGGGTQTYCLERFSGAPGPRAVVRDSGVMTFALARGILRARVRIVQRFARDGVHATQSLTGGVVDGTRAYARARGAISGGGTDVEKPPGHVASSNLRYVVRLRPPPQP